MAYSEDGVVVDDAGSGDDDDADGFAAAAVLEAGVEDDFTSLPPLF